MTYVSASLRRIILSRITVGILKHAPKHLPESSVRFTYSLLYPLADLVSVYIIPGHPIKQHEKI